MEIGMMPKSFLTLDKCLATCKVHCKNMALLAARRTKSFAIPQPGMWQPRQLTAELLAEFGMDPKHLSFWEMGE